MKNLRAAGILEYLEGSSEAFVQLRLREQVPVKELCRALETCIQPRSRQILCDVLGFRGAKTAVPLLIQCLDDPVPNVRASAADALGKVGNPQAGDALLRHFEQEEVIEVRRTLAAVLGAVGHRPAIPVLIKSLSDSDASIRGCAAWALGELRAVEAPEALKQALAHEQEVYPRARIREALDLIDNVETENHSG